MKDLDGKLVLVTGAASGIGRATASAFAARGARLVISDVDQAGLSTLAAELGARCALARRVDVSDRAAMAAFADEVHALAPAVDVIVNNAGVGQSGTMLDTTLADWDWVLGINLGGVIHGCHFFIPRMVERGAGGHVVNISSVLGYSPAPGAIGYITSKFAVLGLTLSLRTELARHRIGVSAVCPGMIDTNIINTTRFASADDSFRDRIGKAFRRRGYAPAKVAESIVAAVRHDRTITPVAPEAWAMWAATRLSTSLVTRISGMVNIT